MPHDSTAIEMSKLRWDSTCEVPGPVSSRQKIGHARAIVLDVLLDEMLDDISGENADSDRDFNKYRRLLNKIFGGWSGRRESNPRMQLGKLPFCH